MMGVHEPTVTVVPTSLRSALPRLENDSVSSEDTLFETVVCAQRL